MSDLFLEVAINDQWYSASSAAVLSSSES